MKNIRVFISENFQFFEVKFSIYLNRCVFIMDLSYMPLIYVKKKFGQSSFMGYLNKIFTL